MQVICTGFSNYFSILRTMYSYVFYQGVYGGYTAHTCRVLSIHEDRPD